MYIFSYLKLIYTYTDYISSWPSPALSSYWKEGKTEREKKKREDVGRKKKEKKQRGKERKTDRWNFD